MKHQNELEDRFLAHCRRQQFFAAGDTVLAAVSGGPDSMVLLHLLRSVADTLKISIAVGHVNHALRGADARKDEALVRTICRKTNLRFHTQKVPTRRHAEKHRQSIEEAARHLRYAAMRRWQKKFKYTMICTAHHQSDQAETVLMRAIKGTGLRGLTGIREVSPGLVRPILFLSRDEIMAYAKAMKIPYRTDRTNSQLTFLRNRIRTEILEPVKQTLDPQAEKHLASLAAIAGHAYDYLRTQAEFEFSDRCASSRNQIILDIKQRRNYFSALSAALFELIFEKLIPDKALLKSADIVALTHLMREAEVGRTIQIGPVTCVKDRQRIVFTTRPTRALAVGLRKIVPGRSYRWRDMTFQTTRVSQATFKTATEPSPTTECVDLDSVDGRLVLRPWKNGDRFYPLGLKGSKRVSDLLTDLKVNPLHRKHVRVLSEQSAAGERIIWVCGYRLDERFKVTSRTQNILRCDCQYVQND